MKFKLTSLCLAAFFAWSLAIAQEATVGGIKAKGATVLSGNELKSLLAGATVRYEVPQFATQMKLDTSGSVGGTSIHVSGMPNRPIPLAGQWKISDKAHWCVTFDGFAPAEDNFCRIVFKLGDRYYFTAAEASDDAWQAFEMRVSK